VNYFRTGTLSSKGPKADLHKLKLLQARHLPPGSTSIDSCSLCFQQIEDDARARLVEVLGVDDEVKFATHRLPFTDIYSRAAAQLLWCEETLTVSRCRIRYRSTLIS
jgi:hypothetical protein